MLPRARDAVHLIRKWSFKQGKMRSEAQLFQSNLPGERHAIKHLSSRMAIYSWTGPFIPPVNVWNISNNFRRDDLPVAQKGGSPSLIQIPPLL
jgi:hypothetical protein